MRDSGLNFKHPVLRILENEHNFLRHLMNEWHEAARGFENHQYNEQSGKQALMWIDERVRYFKTVLNHHLEKEETYLFPSLINYIGGEQGPVLAVEEEHEEIHAYLDHFLHHLESHAIDQLSLEQMNLLIKDALEAFEITMIHFIKEESIVFPMVESVLNKEEQDQLFDQLYTPIVGLKDLLS